MIRRALACCLALGAVADASAQLLWSEEFDAGTVPDPAVWSHDLGGGGWGNSELQEYTDEPANVRVGDGLLTITVREQVGGGAAFSSARIRTQDKVTVRYGTIEARIRIPDLADGLWPAFWTLGNNFPQVGWPACGELDIMEMGHVTGLGAGLANRRVGSAAHWEHQETRADFGQFYDAPADLDEGFHVFRMEWTPASVQTFVDGAPIWTMDISTPSCADCTEFHEPHFIILNVAVGGQYPEIFSPAGITAPLPADLQVDYIRIYDNGHTELGGSAIDSSPPPLGPRHSGSWYYPEQSGHGFSIEVGKALDGSPLAVVYWYTYDDLGSPIFFVGTGVPDGTRLDVDFVSPVGMVFGEFDPDSVVREPAGTGHFDFADRDNGVFSYDPSPFSSDRWGHGAIEDLPLVKLFGIPGTAAARRQ